MKRRRPEICDSAFRTDVLALLADQDRDISHATLQNADIVTQRMNLNLGLRGRLDGSEQYPSTAGRFIYDHNP
jgi:hypothetical protein